MHLRIHYTKIRVFKRLLAMYDIVCVTFYSAMKRYLIVQWPLQPQPDYRHDNRIFIRHRMNQRRSQYRDSLQRGRGLATHQP